MKQPRLWNLMFPTIVIVVIATIWAFAYYFGCNNPDGACTTNREKKKKTVELEQVLVSIKSVEKCVVAYNEAIAVLHAANVAEFEQQYVASRQAFEWQILDTGLDGVQPPERTIPDIPPVYPANLILDPKILVKLFAQCINLSQNEESKNGSQL